MRMKQIVFYFFLLAMPISVCATGLEGDVIYIDGTKWELLGQPIEWNSSLHKSFIGLLPQERSHSTANWDGYTAYWSIQENMLYLDSVRCEIYNTDSHESHTQWISTDTLLQIFKEYSREKRITATWLSGKMRVARGKMLYYEHTAYKRHYEVEQELNIKDGVVKEQETYHNFAKEGFSFDTCHGNPIRDKFPLQLERFPELAQAHRIIFTVKEARVDSTGHLVHCRLTAFVRYEDHTEEHPRIAKEMSELFKAYHPWRVLFINGEYRTMGIVGWSIPYQLKERNKESESKGRR